MPRRSQAIREATLFEMGKPEVAASSHASALELNRPFYEPGLLLGTSSFTATGWSGTFYPAGMKSSEDPTYYASKFSTVEIDSTYYGPPSASTVTRWRDKTPPDFIFAAKVPQTITHEKVLVGCDVEFREFITAMDILGQKPGPLVLQFPSFDQWKFPKQEDFLEVLKPFLKRLPADHKFAIEIRNKVGSTLFSLIFFASKIALVLQDSSFMPRLWEFNERFDFVTANFVYVRWLGDRKSIEEKTNAWDKTVVDRREDLTRVELFRRFVSRGLKIFAYANNHSAGNSPATVELFWELYKER